MEPAGSPPWIGIGAEFHSQSGEPELHHPISAPQENGSSSFTALLELPANQAMELLVHSTDEAAAAAAIAEITSAAPSHLPLPSFPSNAALVGEREAKFSLLANSDRKLMVNSVSLKLEDAGSDSDPKSNSYPNRLLERKLHYSTKRKEREKTEKEGSQKCKKAAKVALEEGAEKPPYVHVRARRGQATDSHSLAERARREKINAKMKLLQEMVPGCNKISGTALVLDEIINHVQSLQRQIEILSMRLATINPTTNISFETLMNDEDGSALDSYFSGMVMPSNWHEEQMHKNGLGHKQFWHTNDFHQLNWRREDEHPDFAIPENSPLIYGYSGNSAPLQMNQVKMEL